MAFPFRFGRREAPDADATVAPITHVPAPWAGSPSSALQAGPYRLQGPLGDGGESHVLLATHRTKGTPAAIKIQRPQVSSARLRREVAILYALQRVETPAVVHLLPAGEDDQVTHHPGVMRGGNGEALLYCALERLPCESERNLIRQRSLRRHDLLQVCQALRIALHVMHVDFQMIHNDLKPRNIVAWREGHDSRLHVRLFDFGQAALLSPHRRTPRPCITPRPSQSYVYLYGSHPYMAPERWRGKDLLERGDTQPVDDPQSGAADSWVPATLVDDRTDQWSFAATFFELLTGSRLVSADKAQNVRQTILDGTYLTAVARARLPGRIKDALQRALAVDAAERYPHEPSVSGLDRLCFELEEALS